MSSIFYTGDEKTDLNESNRDENRFITAKISPYFPIYEWGVPLYQWNMNLLEIFEDKYIFVGCGVWFLRYGLLSNGKASWQPDKKKRVGHNIHYLKRGRLCGIEVIAITYSKGGIEIFDCESFEMIGKVLHRPHLPAEQQVDYSVWSMDIRGNLVVAGSNSRLLQVVCFRENLRQKEKEETRVEKANSLSAADGIVPLSTSEGEDSELENTQDEGGMEPPLASNPLPAATGIPADVIPQEDEYSDDGDDHFHRLPSVNSAENCEEMLLLNAKTIGWIRGHSHNIPSVELNAKGDLVLTGSIDTAVRISNIRGGVCKQYPEQLPEDEWAEGNDWVWRAMWVEPDTVWQIPYVGNTSNAETLGKVPSPESTVITPASPCWEPTISAPHISADDKSINMDTSTPTHELTSEETLQEKLEDEMENKAEGMILEVKTSRLIKQPSSGLMGSEEQVQSKKVRGEPEKLRRVRSYRPSTPPPLATFKLLKRNAISSTMRKVRGLHIPPWLVDIIVAYADETYALVTTTTVTVGNTTEKRSTIRIQDSELNILLEIYDPLIGSFDEHVKQFHRLNFCFRLPGSPIYCIASPACKNILLVGVTQDYKGKLMLKTYRQIEFNPPSDIAPIISPCFITGMTAVQLRPWVYRLYVTRTGIFQIMRGFLEAYTINLQMPATRFGLRVY